MGRGPKVLLSYHFFSFSIFFSLFLLFLFYFFISSFDTAIKFCFTYSLLRLLNHKMSRYGLKFNMAPQSSEEVDLWCDRKKADVCYHSLSFLSHYIHLSPLLTFSAQVNEWLRGRRANALKTGFLESDEEAEIMLPDSLVNFSSFMYSCDHLTSFYPDKVYISPFLSLQFQLSTLLTTLFFSPFLL